RMVFYFYSGLVKRRSFLHHYFPRLHTEHILPSHSIVSSLNRFCLSHTHVPDQPSNVLVDRHRTQNSSVHRHHWQLLDFPLCPTLPVFRPKQVNHYIHVLLQSPHSNHILSHSSFPQNRYLTLVGAKYIGIPLKLSDSSDLLHT